MRRLTLCVSLLAALTALAATAQARVMGHNEGKSSPNAQATVSVFATGFSNPRGLKWGPDGNLYVAEGGTGGKTPPSSACDQVPPPVGPYTGGFNARISKVAPDGTRTTLVGGLPSTSATVGDVSGVADVAFIGDQMYA